MAENNVSFIKFNAKIEDPGFSSDHEVTQAQMDLFDHSEPDVVLTKDEIDQMRNSLSQFDQIEYRDTKVPDKVFFKIGEAALILDVKPHVLRFWESQFPQILPMKTPSGQRVYKKHHLFLLIEIKNLLYQERYAIQAASTLLNERMKHIPFLNHSNKASELLAEQSLTVSEIGQETKDSLSFVQAEGVKLMTQLELKHQQLRTPYIEAEHKILKHHMKLQDIKKKVALLRSQVEQFQFKN